MVRNDVEGIGLQRSHRDGSGSAKRPRGVLYFSDYDVGRVGLRSSNDIDGHHSYYEATRGLGSITMDGLSN